MKSFLKNITLSIFVPKYFYNRSLFFVCSLTLLISSCNKKIFVYKPDYNFTSETGIPEYSNLNYWAAHPDKWDPSDSVPKFLNAYSVEKKDADVFFLYPTSFTDMQDSRWNAPIDDSVINEKTDYSSILYQASVFNMRGKIYAPRYRQANLKVFFTTDSIRAAEALDLAYKDISSAFEYYLKYLNSGRPIIIASHSQGTVHAARLLKDYFEGKPLQKKLVCAYLIGMPIREDYFSKIQPCKDSTSTGCFVSWRTFKFGYTEPTHIAKETFKCIVVNPLIWTSEKKLVERKLNYGGVLKNFNKVIPGIVNAEIHNNVLWTSKPRFFGNIFFTKKNYHVGDINLFYLNIRKNVSSRINMFLKNSQE